jgi:hypothetical protein
MNSKRVVALRDAYPLGLDNRHDWLIKKGTCRRALKEGGGTLGIKKKRYMVHYDERHFRDLTNIEKLTGRKL